MFLDLQMPVMNVWPVLDWIRSVGFRVKPRIFLYSQPRNIGEVQELYKLGADSFIWKPVEEDNLRSLIQNFPNGWELEAGATRSSEALT